MIDVAATHALLAVHTEALAPAGPHAWSFVLPGAAPRAGRAALDDGWLTLTVDGARLRAGAPGDPFAIFAENAALGAGLRCVLAHHGRGLAYRADVALDAESDVASRLAANVAAVVDALVIERDTERDARDVAPATVARTPLLPALARRCGDTGWPVAPRGDDGLAIDLACAGPSRSALVTAADDRVAVTLSLTDPLAPAPASPIGARAAARLLMQTAGLVRLVRTVARAGDPASLRFEIVATDPSTHELARAFGALATAADVAAAEVTTLLHDEAVARLYLQQRADAAVPRAA